MLHANYSTPNHSLVPFRVSIKTTGFQRHKWNIRRISETTTLSCGTSRFKYDKTIDDRIRPVTPVHYKTIISVPPNLKMVSGDNEKDKVKVCYSVASLLRCFIGYCYRALSVLWKFRIHFGTNGPCGTWRAIVRRQDNVSFLINPVLLEVGRLLEGDRGGRHHREALGVTLKLPLFVPDPTLISDSTWQPFRQAIFRSEMTTTSSKTESSQCGR